MASFMRLSGPSNEPTIGQKGPQAQLYSVQMVSGRFDQTSKFPARANLSPPSLA